ncbi:MAG: helix-turn-helix transcriptional regulator [Silvanigrellales bacterium]|jgi:transcriptional regulator with XRE-family HTH domain|nr:helix-turn-helix transcriptional regulator [Silvanigrellales bacterium]
MTKTRTPLLPRVQARVQSLGARLRQSRLRRHFSLAIVAERAGISVESLRRLELGKGTSSVGTLANVLFVLGLDNDLETLARDDELGRKLQDLEMPTRARAPRMRRQPPGEKAATEEGE